MYLYFLNANHNYRLLNDQIKDIDDKQIAKTIQQFLKDHNYKSYYTRSWENGEGDMVYDVGSWSEFFILSKLPKEDAF